jgi:hypothetical protein
MAMLHLRDMYNFSRAFRDIFLPKVALEIIPLPREIALFYSYRLKLRRAFVPAFGI